MSLTEYQRKRNFARTPEPRGKIQRHRRTHFYIQKHAASHLHYDFRLELEGVLKSWAVPHGPCLDPSQKRLAVQVEDHPVEYGTFEGKIPEGQYGGGTVLLWDQGTWSPIGDPGAGYRSGKLKFALHGKKLQGGWTLVRMHPKPGTKGVNWLLIKERDSYVVPLSQSDVLEAEPQSVSSGKTLEELSGAAQRTSSNSKPSTRKHASAKRTSTKANENGSLPRKQTTRRSTTQHTAARKAAFPSAIEPELATLVKEPPEGSEWLHEVKFDGYRILGYLNRGKAALHTRNQLDWTARFPEVAETLIQLPVKQAVFDGEIVALDADSKSSFQALQEALTAGDTSGLQYVVFDLLYAEGRDLRELPLQDRRSKLFELVGHVDLPQFTCSQELQGSGQAALQAQCQRGFEGIVSKRKDEPYKAGRVGDWCKSKCSQTAEFVIGGFTDSTSTRKKLGALLIGYHDQSGQLVYSGKVGTGFSEQTLAQLHGLLSRAEQQKCPFEDSNGARKGRGVHWVKPQRVAQIGFTNWTRDGRLRHPVFQGLREDKPAAAVTREIPKPPAELPAPQPTSKAPPMKPEKQRARMSDDNQLAGTLSPGDIAELGKIELTHPDRIVYPSVGLTKLDVATYYASICEWIMPHITKRPLSILRCPAGQGGQAFFQKHAGKGVPQAIHQIEIEEKHKRDKYITIDSVAGLLSLVQIGMLEIHPWGSRNDDVDRADQMTFDFDPDPQLEWTQIVAAAKAMRDRLQDLGLKSLVKTTGGKGLHVVVPLARRCPWAELKAFAKSIAEQMAADSPALYTTNMSKAVRQSKIFIDYLRNDRGATAVAPYSTRNREQATVAAPITWKECSAGVSPANFTVQTMVDRLNSLKADPWEEYPVMKQSITAKMQRSVGL